MPALEGMHAPNNEYAHLLPPVGYTNPIPSDLFRFNRVTPYYPPDPCIRPNEADLVCAPEETEKMRNCPWMPPAGNDVRMASDIFRFHKVYPSVGCNPCNPATCPETGPILQSDVCPCTHRQRFAPSNPRRHFDYRYPGGASNLVPELVSFDHGMADGGGGHNTFCPHHAVQHTQAAYHPERITHTTETIHPPKPQTNFQNSFQPGGIPHSSGMAHANGTATSSGQCRDYNDGQLPPDPYSVAGNVTYGGNYVFRRKHQYPADQARGTIFRTPDPNCARPYNPSAYVCRPVYNRKYLLDCPTQDGPPADSYTFL